MPEVTTSRQVERLPGGGPHHHLAALALTEGPEHQRIGIAWLDGCPGSPAVELTIDLAPGHRDLPDVVALVREAADAAAELDVDTVEVRFDPGEGFPVEVLQACGLPWRAGATPGSASIDVGHPRTHPPLIEGEGP